MNDLKVLIEKWAINKGLHTLEPSKQMLKLMEEVGELAGALAKQKKHEVVDSIGDIFVVLTILSLQLKLDIGMCIESAYNEIKDRKGKVVDGIFIKEEK